MHETTIALAYTATEKGETGTGAEFGIRCHVTAYDINSGKKVWRAYSMGPDSDILVDPEKTMSLGKPVGENSSRKLPPRKIAKAAST